MKINVINWIISKIESGEIEENQIVVVYDKNNNVKYLGKAEFAPLSLLDEFKTATIVGGELRINERQPERATRGESEYKMSNEEIIRALESIIATAEEFKDAYFLKPPTNAISRRIYEKYHSVPFFTFEYNRIKYTCEYHISCSCNNVYAQGHYTRNGNKTTLTAIKNVLKKMKVEANENE